MFEKIIIDAPSNLYRDLYLGTWLFFKGCLQLGTRLVKQIEIFGFLLSDVDMQIIIKCKLYF